jgi:hypothetical protein
MSEIIQAGKFLSEQYTRVEPNIIETIYPELWGFEGLHHQVEMGGVSLATEQIVTLRVDRTGTAVNYGGKATDIPLANYGIETDKYKVSIGVLGAEWHYTELVKQQEALNSQTAYSIVPDVVSNYMMALEKGLREYVHLRTLFGNYDPLDPTTFTGLFNNPQVELINETTDLYALTPIQLYQYFLDVITNYKKSTKLTGGQIELLVNSDLYNRLTSINNSGIDANITPYMLLTDPMRGSGVARISEVNELTWDVLEQYKIFSSGTNKDMYCLFNVNSAGTPPNRLKKTMDIFYTPEGLKDDQMTYRKVGLVAVSELIFNAPFLCKYYSYPKP